MLSKVRLRLLNAFVLLLEHVIELQQLEGFASGNAALLTLGRVGDIVEVLQRFSQLLQMAGLRWMTKG